MKVAFISRYPQNPETPRGGVESVTVILSAALLQAGVDELHIITLEKKIEKDRVDKINGIFIHRLKASSWPQMLDVIGGPGRKKIIDTIREINPDIVHSHETYGMGMADIGIPHVFTVHGFDHANVVAEERKYSSLRSVLWHQVERFGLSRQTRIISISPYVTDMLAPLTRASITEIDNPVDSGFFTAERRVDEKPRILCVGWISERKNTLTSVQAFARISRDFPAAKLIIAGSAKSEEYMIKVRSAIEDGDISDKVEFLGHIGRDRLLGELTRAAVLLLPSLQENAPMAVSEAMAVGVPVIASNRCGMPHMVKEGVTGYLVEPYDIDAIEGRMRRLLSNADLYTAMSVASGKVARERFYPSIVASRTMNVYESTVARKYTRSE